MGFVLMTLMTAATWAPTFLIREHHVTVEHAGYTYGFITLLVAVPGVYFGGWLADKLSNGGVRNAYLKTIVGATLAMMPCIIAAPLFSSYSAAAAGFALFLFFNGTTNGVAVTYIQSITPAHVRSQVSALYLLSINLIGFCGPTLLPLLARTVTESGKSIGTPLSLLGGAASLGAVLIFLLNWRAFDAAQGEH
jgi:MFS family permease